jgi:hypothetical protein
MRRTKYIVALTGLGILLLVVAAVGLVLSSNEQSQPTVALGPAVAHRQTGEPTTEPTTLAPGSGNQGLSTEGTDAFPDCIPVTDRSGNTAGCIKKSDEFAPPPVYDRMAATGGLPVYDLKDQSTIVGRFQGGVGFVPEALTTQMAQLQACTDALIAHLTDPGAAPPTSDCRSLLLAQGYPESTVDG